MNKWFITDDDCMQYCKQLSETEFQFIQIVWLDTCSGDKGYPDKEYTVMSAYVDLDLYDENSFACAASSYGYETIENMKKEYGDSFNQIMAECLFEDMTDGSCSTYGMMTKNEAKIFVNKYIEEN